MLFTCPSCGKNYQKEDKPTCCNTPDCGWCHGMTCYNEDEEGN